jgi:hypothetical protein
MPGAGVVHHIIRVAFCNTWLSVNVRYAPFATEI